MLLSCVTYLWHWGQHKKLRYIRDNKILLRDLYEVDPAGPGKAGESGTGALGGKGMRSTAFSVQRLTPPKALQTSVADQCGEM